MTQFTPASLPASCTTVEAVAVWALTVLNRLYPDAVSVETLDENREPVETRCVSTDYFYIQVSTPPAWRHLSRLSLGLRKEYQEGGQIWTHVRVLGDEAIPGAMKV